MPYNADLFQEWRAADRIAFAAERELARASLAAIQSNQPWPSSVERDNVHRLRKTADDLFQVAMAQMSEAAGRAAGP